MSFVKGVSPLIWTPRAIRDVVAGPGLAVQRSLGVSRTRQLAHIVRYKRRLGASRSEYYGYELFRPDVTAGARDAYLMQLSWNALSAVLNEQTGNIDSSKLLQARRFAHDNIPTPLTLAYTALDPGDRERSAPEFVSLTHLAGLIPPTGCVFKRDRSMSGRGVLVFKSCKDGMLEHVDGRRLHVTRLQDALRDPRGRFLVQERVENHSKLATLDLPSLATLRVVTYGQSDNIRIARAALKIPVGRSGVDNYHAGGLAAPVDLDSGRVGPGAPRTGLDRISSHPESGKRFEGMIIPLWADVVTQARRAALAMPEFPCVGWDIAVTADGVRIIEGNSAWGTRIVQRPHGAGIWQGDFREWCLGALGNAVLPKHVRRWLQI